MVGDARLLILLPLETRQVAPDNTVVLTLKLSNETLVAPYSTDNRSKNQKIKILNTLSMKGGIKIAYKDLSFDFRP